MKQFGPAGFPIPSLNDAQYYTKTLDSGDFVPKHEIIRIQANASGVLRVTCPGQGPIAIPLVASDVTVGMFYIPPGTILNWATS